MKKKLDFSKLSVQSFVTSLNNEKGAYLGASDLPCQANESLNNPNVCVAPTQKPQDSDCMICYAPTQKPQDSVCYICYQPTYDPAGCVTNKSMGDLYCC